MARYLVDASVWASYLRGSPPELQFQVDRLLDENRAALSGFILAGLLAGTPGKKDREYLAESLQGLPWLEATRAIFTAAGEMGAGLRRKGHTAALPDLLILAQARAHGLIVLTLDYRLRALAGLAGVPATAPGEP